jgi:phage-related protein
MGDEYLPPVVTKLKADLSDFMAGIIEARAAMRQFAQDTHADLANATRAAGGEAGFVMITEMRTVIKKQMDGLDDDVEAAFTDQLVPQFAKGGSNAGMGFAAAFRVLAIPLLIGALVAAAPGIATAIAGAIQLGIGLGFIGLGAFMLRQEPLLIAAATRFRDRVAAVFRNASAPMLVPLIRALDILGASFERLGPMISRSFAALAPAIEPLAVGLAGMMEAMGPGLTELVIAAGPIIMEFAKQLPGIGKSLGEFFSMIAKNAPTIGEFINDMGRVIPAIVRGLSGMLDFLIGIYAVVHDIHAAMKGAGWETPFHGFVTTGKAVWSWMQETGPKIGNWFSERGQEIADWTGNAVDKAGEFVTNVGNWFADLPGKAAAGLAALPGVLARGAQVAFDGFFYYGSLGATRLIQSLINLPGQIGQIIVRLWNTVTSYFSQGVDTTITAAKSLPERLGVLLADMVLMAAGWIFDLKTKIVTLTGQAIIGVREWFFQLPGLVGASLVMMKDRAVGFFWDASKWLYDAGKSMIQGLIGGIMSAVDAAVNAIKRALDRIKRGAKEALQSNSPSLVYEEMGRWTMQGYIQGILGERGNLASVMGMFAPPNVAAARNNGLALAAAGGGAGGAGVGSAERPILVRLVLDGSVLVEKLITPAQQRKLRTGATGLA